MSNSAQWVAWGLVQAHVPGMPDIKDDGTIASNTPTSTATDGKKETPSHTEMDAEEKAQVDKEIEADQEEKEEDAEFDYLSYARDRAMLFWGHAPNSQTRMPDSKRAMEKLDLLVVIDPYPTVTAILHDRKDGVYLLPATTQFETDGSATWTVLYGSASDSTF